MGRRGLRQQCCAGRLGPTRGADSAGSTSKHVEKGTFIDSPSTELLDQAVAGELGTYVNNTNAMNGIPQ